jgi:hypothetical protein
MIGNCPTGPVSACELVKIFGVPEIDTGKEILHLIVAGFIVRLLTNNHQESIAGYLLIPLERDELHTQQKGFQTIAGSVQLPIWRPGRARLSEVTFETTILD